MTPFDFFLVLATLALGLGGLWVWTYTQLNAGRRETAQMQQRIQQLQSALDAIIGAASGTDARLTQLDKRTQELHRKHELMEETQKSARPYDQAIHLVRQGASAERLMEELGLARSEADLLIMLHGKGPEHTH